jgi:aryl-alcohol dehydrogenase-like predicted oxidoreductase
MITPIETRVLGKSDLKVTPIGLGCWQFSKQQNLAGKFWSNLDDPLIQQIVKVSLEGGINWFDTAEAYGNGASEKALAKALVNLGKKPGEVLIATKWWPAVRTARSIFRTIDERLAALKPFPIDLYQVHWPWGLSSEKKEMEAMIKLVEAGKIRYPGISNFSARKMRSAWETLQKHGLPLVSNQVRYSLLDRTIESNGILQTANELGITIIAYSPLAQGILTGKFHDNPDLLKNIGLRKRTSVFKSRNLAKCRNLVSLIKELAGKYQVTPAQIALNWLLYFHGNTVVAIPGATLESHALENVGAMKFRMSEEDMERLDRESVGYK